MSDNIVRADMPADVLDGRLGELCQRHLDRFPLAYSWGALVTGAGALIPRVKSSIRTNLFWCAVGPPGTGKSQSMETVLRLLGMWVNNPVLIKGKYGSAEGLIEKLEDLEPDAARLIHTDELGHLMAKAAIDRSSFPYVLNSAYYDDQQSGGTKGNQYQLDCRLSVSGGLVEELFGDSFGTVSTGGLYDRFLFGLCPEPFQFLWRPFDEVEQSLNPFAASIESDVWDARDEWVRSGMSARVAEHALRVAYICACVDGRTTLRTADLGPARALADYQKRVRVVLAPNPGENPDARCAVAIRAWLNDHDPGTWVRRRDLDRGINGTRFGPGVFNRCLQNLMFNDEVEVGGNQKFVRLIDWEDLQE